ncbi:MAG: hypothetical protein F6K10_11190 [Moorea sp. SIO2B7]|uniref:TerB family tellurite resistance protein n=1 Tax=Moorena producens (strain JHB) TaxID=1454205 RepID=A0A1D9G532_MOOP1|nr:hypothetical protein [Moorena producens]AOY82747.1 hypothetical protein BJP36_25410 [Moorena producens JHB]NES81915.1 hypothetical protein [Moorena sp. SIO2B7]
MDNEPIVWDETIPAIEDYEALMKAVLICTKGDGVLAAEERDWVVGRAAAYHNPGVVQPVTHQFG